MFRYDGRNALVLGAGRSGVAAAELMLVRRGHATIVDEKWTLDHRAEVGMLGISCLSADAEHLPDGSYDLLIVSPSIPMSHPWLQIARKRGLSIISELELGAHYWQGEVLAVTGSKGKSSVVKCLADTLTRSGRPAVTAGNYGVPLSQRVLECADGGRGTIAVVEVSSFQMEHTRRFSPRLAAILNVQADHLDRHGSLAEYEDLKQRLFQAMKPETSVAYLPPSLEPSHLPQGVALERFGLEDGVDWQATPGMIRHGELKIPLTGYFNNPVLGRAAALIAAMLTQLGLSPAQIAEGFAEFQPLAHRMQRLGEVKGVVCIDDSKGTSLAATQAALQMAGRGQPRIHLIAGGLLKESDLTFLAEELRANVRQVYLIGQAQEALQAAWSPLVACVPCGTMAEAVKCALQSAEAGDTLLLSPGCASFDQYPSMAARGEDFARACGFPVA